MQVLASYGHVRDLPSKAGSVLPDQDFAMLWEQLRVARPRLQDIGQATKQAQTLILATDPDREGEAISWHVQQELAVRLSQITPPVADRSCQPMRLYCPH